MRPEEFLCNHADAAVAVVELEHLYMHGMIVGVRVPPPSTKCKGHCGTSIVVLDGVACGKREYIRTTEGMISLAKHAIKGKQNPSPTGGHLLGAGVQAGRPTAGSGKKCMCTCGNNMIVPPSSLKENVLRGGSR